jgi:hypothetical protein
MFVPVVFSLVHGRPAARPADAAAKSPVPSEEAYA